MGRGLSYFFGLCLVALFIIGLATASWTGWLIWLDLVAAVCAIGAAGVASGRAPTAVHVGGPVAVSIGVLVLWIIGLLTGAQSTQVWLNFIVGIVYLLSEIGASASREAASPGTTSQWRKSA